MSRSDKEFKNHKLYTSICLKKNKRLDGNEHDRPTLPTQDTILDILLEIPLPTHKIVLRLLVSRVQMDENINITKKGGKKDEGLSACLDVASPEPESPLVIGT